MTPRQMTSYRMSAIVGEYGLLVPFLRQAWTLRNHPQIGAAMRADIRYCIRALRWNRSHGFV